MKQISKDETEKLISKRELLNKIIGQLLWLPIAGLGLLLYKIVLEVWPLLVSKVLPELSKELLTKWIVALYLLCLFLVALCILLSIRLRQKPLKEVIDMRDDKYFKT